MDLLENQVPKRPILIQTGRRKPIKSGGLIRRMIKVVGLSKALPHRVNIINNEGGGPPQTPLFRRPCIQIPNMELLAVL